MAPMTTMAKGHLAAHLDRRAGIGDVQDQVIAAGAQHDDAGVGWCQGFGNDILTAQVADGAQPHSPVDEFWMTAEGVLPGLADGQRGLACHLE